MKKDKAKPVVVIIALAVFWGVIGGFFLVSVVLPAERSTDAASARAAYLSIDKLYSSRAIEHIENLLATTEINAVVIDFKVGKPQLDDYLKKLILRFKSHGAYVIGRQVVFQDTYYASHVRPDLALRMSNGDFWYSGRKSWMRYWVDMSSPEVWNYNIKVAKDGLDAGFDEINFDYIRFPSDGPANPVYPYWNGKTSKRAVLEEFFKRLHDEIKAYKPNAVLSIDIYGYVFLTGAEPGVGQDLLTVSKYFDVISPMAYPSHYRCKEFGIIDPTTAPGTVYGETLSRGNEILSKAGIKVIIRPWIEDFMIDNIYGCKDKNNPQLYFNLKTPDISRYDIKTEEGFKKYKEALLEYANKRVDFMRKKVQAELGASRANGAQGFMLWNAGSSFTKGALFPK